MLEPFDGSTAPLTPEQRNWLRINAILPTVFVLPIVTVFALVLFAVHRTIGAHPAVRIFIGIAALLLVGVSGATALHVANHVRDLRRGTSRIAHARVLRKHRTTRSPRTCSLELEGIGSVTVLPDVYEHAIEGRTYRVLYSPCTKRGWKVE